jgi:glycosyltransferase involved in cell wall biosynthesis
VAAPRPLRVALDAVPLLDHPTGVGRFVGEVVARLAPRDDLDLVAYGWPIGGRNRMQAAVPEGVATARWPMVGPPQRALWRRCDLPPVELWTGPVDVVHGPNFVVPPARRAAEVVTVHDVTIVRHPELCTSDTLQFPPLIQRAIRRGAWVHTVSEFVAGEVVELLGVPAERVVAIPNGVTRPAVLSGTPEAAAEAARGRALARAERYVLAVGTVEPRKDLPGLVAAFDAVAATDPDLALVIVGPDGWGADALTAAIHRAAHRHRILRLGWASDADRAALLRGASVLAYPSLYEGFGLPPLEAMAAGTPVVTTDCGAIPEVVGDAAVIVPGGDVDALAGGLAAVLGDEALADDLRARGAERVDRYPWDATADRLAQLYHCAAGMMAP